MGSSSMVFKKFLFRFEFYRIILGKGKFWLLVRNISIPRGLSWLTFVKLSVFVDSEVIWAGWVILLVDEGRRCASRSILPPYPSLLTTNKPQKRSKSHLKPTYSHFCWENPSRNVLTEFSNNFYQLKKYIFAQKLK